MKFSLIICTYMRPLPLIQLLQSVKLQTLYPYEVLIVDGSNNDATEKILAINHFENLKYFKVDEDDRGLTRQRNFGIAKVDSTSEIICFLDDDTVLEANYFEEIIKTFQLNQLISGVGGVAINENKWIAIDHSTHYNHKKCYQFEGFVYPEGQRNVLRNYLGLQSNLMPGKMPEYSHGRTCGFPLTGKVYEVDLLIGMSMAFRKRVIDNIQFSSYFEGYGLYEDADFSIRALKLGKNVINTNAQLSHFHDPSGRPNKYKYGKMVVRNGWYVWRVKNPNPSLKVKLKWHVITIVLIMIRYSNSITINEGEKAITEALGRTIGWLSLLVSKPKIEN